MKKTWLYSAMACLTLLATACGYNAAPDYTNRNDGGTVRNQAVPGYPRIFNDRNMIGPYNGNNFGTMGAYTGTDNTAFGLDRTDGYYGTTSNNAGFRGMRSYNAFDGTAGTRGTVQGPLTLYRDRGMGTFGTNNMSQFGYANVTRSSLRANATPNIHVDRDTLARIVGNVTASCPGVLSSTVLVTDEEIFVGLHTRGGDNRTAKSQARMNAMSVSPRYYKVYVTDNQRMINEMTRIASRGSNLNANQTQNERTIDSLIRSFGGLADGDEMGNRGTNRTTEMRGNMGTTGTTSR
jgi:hypothetical protein